MKQAMHNRRQWLSCTGTLLLSSGHSPTFAAAPPPVLVPRSLTFPRDHGSHLDTRTEWWYLTGVVQDRSGQDWGFQVTFFRSRVDPAARLTGRLAARHLLFAHAAITDLSKGQLHHDQRLARWNGRPPGDPLAQHQVSASEIDTAVHLHDWHLERNNEGDYLARIRASGFAIDIRAAPTQALLLQGDQGFSRKGPDEANASFYVTHPQLQVSGTLQIGHDTHPVKGRAWLDHEWSEALLHPEAVGWDWVGMNLHDGSSLTAFQLRRADGSALWTGGSWRQSTGNSAHVFQSGEVHWDPKNHWQSPQTGGHYPLTWRLSTPAGTFTVQALAAAQELDSRASTGTVYWEGASELRDPQGDVIGRGYLEMTGYVGRLIL